jgi:ribosome-associated translation inhibitor RaiA
MGDLDFHIEFQSDVAHLDDALVWEAERRLRELAKGQTDLIGAAVAVESLAGQETGHVFQARVVAYVRPDNIVAVEKRNAPETALKGALDAVERQVREMREKLRKPWQQPSDTPDIIAGE